MELDDEIKEKILKILDETDTESETDYSTDSTSDTDNINILDTDNNTSEEDENNNCCTNCITNEKEDNLYKIRSQFQDLQLNMLTSDNILEILKNVQDNKLREKIIQMSTNSSSTSSASSSRRPKT